MSVDAAAIPGMSLFVAHRFSAGISALTVRYHQWERYADAIEFKRIELLGDEPMWSLRGIHTTPRAGKAIRHCQWTPPWRRPLASEFD